ncbi:hypothetical protein HME7025_01646 [Aquirufa nivalisilvae]|uniref:Uncharacterized protein n=1 Tax=Aquirufa nivalisilvae TaxID=2516557 RepID=A0A2S2DW00_9BACT|nr:hypothetical protein [Aquirufa nivalisilvae]AWL09499.1 hypothetical protein HME7025_01646 [Aquirufa nivalisilvae]
MEIEQIKSKVINFFNGNPALNIISLLLGVAGILFSFYFYFKSKRSKIPTFAIRTINLIRDKIQKIDTVEILYSGEKVNNLSISKIAIWNDGKETINKTDVASNNPLKIKIKDNFKFLDAKVLYQKNDANDFIIQISTDRNFINIAFDYFDFEDGIVLELFHTGNTSEDLYIDGKIKSVKSIIRRDSIGTFLPSSIIKWLRNDKEIISKSNMRTIMGWLVLMGGISICCLAIYTPFRHVDSTLVPRQMESSYFAVTMSTVLGLLYIWYGYRMLKRNIPKGFDIFNEEFLQTK